VTDKKLNHTTLRVLEYVRGHSDADVRDMMAALHLTDDPIIKALYRLRDLGLVRVSSHRRRKSGPLARLWSVGAAPDAEPPPPLSNAEKSAAWRKSGGDAHKNRTLQRQASKIAKGMTLAGLLGL